MAQMAVGDGKSLFSQSVFDGEKPFILGIAFALAPLIIGQGVVQMGKHSVKAESRQTNRCKNLLHRALHALFIPHAVKAEAVHPGIYLDVAVDLHPSFLCLDVQRLCIIQAADGLRQAVLSKQGSIPRLRQPKNQDGFSRPVFSQFNGLSKAGDGKSV